jgi:hypothetical protein
MEPQEDMEWIGPGNKFDHDGNIQSYPGTTVICHLPQDSNLWQALAALQAEIRKQDFASFFVFLPKSSWHMTVFEGVSDRNRKPGVWPKDLALDASLSSCRSLFEERLKSFRPSIQLPIRMKVTDFEPLKPGIALQVRPIDEAQNHALRTLRNEISELLGVRFPQHDIYSFHISLSYSLERFDKVEHDMVRLYLDDCMKRLPKIFELGVPEYCIFEDMFGFDKVFNLQCGGSDRTQGS